jgi:TonB family protein
MITRVVVPFPPLGATGLDSASRARRAWELLLTATFAAAHLSGLLVLRGTTPAEAGESLAGLETATYLDIPPPTAVTSPRRVAKPRPVGVSSAVTIPAVQSEVIRPDKAAGFQELTAPSDLAALPQPDPGADAVDAKDFSGRGVVGGVAGGKPPPVIAADLAAEMAREGLLSDAVEAGSNQAMAIELVTVKPQLINREEMLAVLLRQYPPSLRQFGVEGSAIVQFVVDTNGRVEPRSVTLLSSTHPLFGSAAIEVARKARFTPGRVASGTEMVAVPVMVRAPLKWTQAPSK